jgi:hypothetical protein
MEMANFTVLTPIHCLRSLKQPSFVCVFVQVVSLKRSLGVGDGSTYIISVSVQYLRIYNIVT